MYTMAEMKESKPFVLFRTKEELVLSKEQGQLEFGDGVTKELERHKLKDVLGAKMKLNSPPKVIEVKAIQNPEEFFDLAF